MQYDIEISIKIHMSGNIEDISEDKIEFIVDDEPTETSVANKDSVVDTSESKPEDAFEL